LSVDANRHVVLQEFQAVEAPAFFKGLGDVIAASGARDVLVFVPGFNVDFESAMLRLGQLSYDLGLGSPTILFSWPSQAAMTAYVADQESVLYAVPHFLSFLNDLIAQPNIGHIHVLAHGLGCRLAIDSLLKFQGKAPKLTAATNLILVSPDVDRDLLLMNSARLAQVVNRITVYVSSNDRVLQVAKSVAGAPRAGDSSEGIPVFPSAETIDVSAKDSSLLGYGVTSVLPDIYSILKDGAPADQRMGLRRASVSGRTYWIHN
jgi:esterase/lipase superfamily enzyme